MKSHRTVARLVAPALVVSCALGIAGCAPEPIVGNGGKGSTTAPSESAWSSPTASFDPEQTNTKIPASFPSDGFTFPADARVINVGERGQGVWFLVLGAPTEADALTIWNSIITANGFHAVEDEGALKGEKHATLSSATLTVEAALLPAPDGTGTVLSYDITALV